MPKPPGRVVVDGWVEVRAAWMKFGSATLAMACRHESFLPSTTTVYHRISVLHADRSGTLLVIVLILRAKSMVNDISLVDTCMHA